MKLTESVWPPGIRAAAVFTFDNDDESGLIDGFGPDKMFSVSQGYYDTNAGTARVLRVPSPVASLTNVPCQKPPILAE